MIDGAATVIPDEKPENPPRKCLNCGGKTLAVCGTRNSEGDTFLVPVMLYSHCQQCSTWLKYEDEPARRVDHTTVPTLRPWEAFYLGMLVQDIRDARAAMGRTEDADHDAAPPRGGEGAGAGGAIMTRVAADRARDPLYAYTIYRRPRDYPESYVVRRFVIGFVALPIPEPDPVPVAVTDTLAEARASLPGGVTNLGRYLADEPQIVETWV